MVNRLRVGLRVVSPWTGGEHPRGVGRTRRHGWGGSRFLGLADRTTMKFGTAARTVGSPFPAGTWSARSTPTRDQPGHQGLDAGKRDRHL